MTGQSDFEVTDHKKLAKDPRSFVSQKPWSRLIILAAGVAMNFVLAAALLSAGFMIGLPSAISDGMPGGASVTDERVQIVLALDDSPAKEAGLRSGDAILKLNAYTPETADDVINYINDHRGEPITLTMERGQEIFTEEVIPRVDPPANEGPIGISLASTGRVSFPWYLAIWQGIKATGELTVQIVLAFGRLIGALVSTGQVSGDVAGPIGIAVLTGQVTQLGFVYVLQFTALLSINLAIINILPFPALDGGHLLFLFIEKIRGGKTPKAARVENVIHLVGFAILLGLIGLVTFRDISKFWGKIVSWFT